MSHVLPTANSSKTFASVTSDTLRTMVNVSPSTSFALQTVITTALNAFARRASMKKIRYANQESLATLTVSDSRTENVSVFQDIPKFPKMSVVAVPKEVTMIQTNVCLSAVLTKSTTIKASYACAKKGMATREVCVPYVKSPSYYIRATV